jgi:hypothetical protein
MIPFVPVFSVHVATSTPCSGVTRWSMYRNDVTSL